MDRYLSAPEKDDIDTDNNLFNSTDEDSRCKVKNNKNINNENKNKFNLLENDIKNPFSLACNNENKNVKENDDLLLEKDKKISITRRKTRIVLDEINTKSKNSKNYALEFENLYDNFEREVDFVDKIENKNSINSESFKEENNSLRKKSSIVNPFGFVNRLSKKDETFNDDYFNDAIDNYIEDYCNDLPKRKSSILGILESNVIKKRNSFIMEQ